MLRNDDEDVHDLTTVSVHNVHDFESSCTMIRNKGRPIVSPPVVPQPVVPQPVVPQPLSNSEILIEGVLQAINDSTTVPQANDFPMFDGVQTLEDQDFVGIRERHSLTYHKYVLLVLM